jgi:hypothetical protein
MVEGVAAVGGLPAGPAGELEAELVEEREASPAAFPQAVNTSMPRLKSVAQRIRWLFIFLYS